MRFAVDGELLDTRHMRPLVLGAGDVLAVYLSTDGRVFVHKDTQLYQYFYEADGPGVEALAHRFGVPALPLESTRLRGRSALN